MSVTISRVIPAVLTIVYKTALIAVPKTQEPFKKKLMDAIKKRLTPMYRDDKFLMETLKDPWFNSDPKRLPTMVAILSHFSS